VVRRKIPKVPDWTRRTQRERRGPSGLAWGKKGWGPISRKVEGGREDKEGGREDKEGRRRKVERK